MVALARWDRSGVGWARTRRHVPAGDALAANASRAVEHARLWLGCCAAGVVIDRDHRGGWLRAGIVVAAAETGSQALKRVVRRARPVLEGLPPLAETPSVYSFPSAHTASSVAAARAFPRGRPWLGAMAVAMGLSRPYLGVHYPSDVIAGVGVGWLAAAVVPRRRAC
jgi:membrane-associated phospholipid phosphatase